ncbi:alpha/beta-hydrolase [Trametes versicolor FP-101664 SS1]|uniref:alpha/beta-hydrolase n=1 Tax=Trametes versicolor (strain FP-101664) TaxID=717944 RepID=UPI0004621A95|nr:alpha/beta-hydrolase [Trametes versicolor FP-101664 SS1]EIW62589.1 alpha/beta-hydrolase [Trametes versicolor FP-101664 SS1]
MDLALYKDTIVSRGFTYHYFYSPAASGQPTLLLVHGFPSSSYDWRRQVAYFQPKGYGILVPDLLGAGGTSKPDSADAFRFALIARDLVDVLDAEGLQTVVGIGHDWGSAVLSRLANLYSGRFHAFAWLALSYFPPAWQTSGLADAGAMSTQFGYWEYLSRDDAFVMTEKNLDSFLLLAYPETPDHWHKSLAPLGKTQVWIEANRQTGLPDWLPQEEYDVMREILANAGLKSVLNYYKAMVSGANAQDEKSIPSEAHMIQKPALFIASACDPVCTAGGGKTVMAQYAPHATIVELDVGHWPHLEETEKVNLALEKWLETLNLGKL